MTPTDTIIALEKALEAGPSLHNQIMNLQCDSDDCPIGGANALLGYKHGHREARHAAAELASEKDAAIRTLLDAHASALRDAARYRWLRDSCLDWEGNSDDGKWSALHFECQEGILDAYVPATLDAAIDAARAALDDNTKGSAAAIISDEPWLKSSEVQERLNGAE